MTDHPAVADTIRRARRSALRRAKVAWRQLVDRREPATSRRAPAPTPAAPPPAKDPTLLRIATDGGWQLDGATRVFVKQLDNRLKRRAHDNLAVLADASSAPLADALAARWPQSRIVLLVSAPATDPAAGGEPSERVVRHHLGTDAETHSQLSAHGPYDAIIDATGAGAGRRRTVFAQTFFHLRVGGVYLIRSFQSGLHGETDATGESVWQFVARMVDYRSRGTDTLTPQHPEDPSFANAIGTVIVEEELLLVTSTATAMPKMRDAEIDYVLDARPGEPMGAVLQVLPPLEFSSRCRLRVNDHRWDARFASSYHVPKLSLREYANVTCAPHQVVISDGIVLPESYRHYTHPRLTNRFTTEVTNWFATYPKDLTAATLLTGTYYYLDSEWPHHFGHVMTEQLSRLWAWSEAKRRYPDAKALVPLPGGQAELAAFEVAIFTGSGIQPDDLVTCSGPVRVERLLAATPMLVNPDYIHPDIAKVWRTVGDALMAAAPERDYPEKFFCSRRPSYKRACHNVAEVESAFAAHGFAVVYPEDYSPAEQAAMFDRARVIGGFAGSALFSLNFCSEPKRVIMISSESYTARNEYMISSVLGNQMDVIWCQPDVPQPKKGWDGKAFASGFRFDFARDGAQLDDILRTA